MNDVFSPQRVADDRWEIDVIDRLAIGPAASRYLFGGAGLALALRVMEAFDGRPVLWATAQYLASVPSGSRLVLTAESFARGKNISHVRVVASIGDVAIQAIGSTGLRSEAPALQWPVAPPARDPAECPVVVAHREAHLDIHSNMELRIAQGRFGVFGKEPVSPDGRVLVWIRPLSGRIDPAILAVMADFIPSACSNALAKRSGGRSLDNSLRICRIVQTDWVLCELVVDSIAGGIGHGHLNLFAQDGTLLATGGQTFKVNVLAER